MSGEESESVASVPLARLLERLGYCFRNEGLVVQALTHRSSRLPGLRSSSVGQNPLVGGEEGHYERLEFLGDAVLGLLVSRLLFFRFPQASEGALSQWRSQLVSTESLAAIGRDLALGGCLQLGRGEVLSGGRNKSSIMADAVEAVLGAIYLDGGEEGVLPVVERLFGPLLSSIDPEHSGKDFKTLLQERLQADGLSLPTYLVVAVAGAAHDRTFTVECVADGVPPGRGEGRSKRQAEQEAARSVWQWVENGA